jgi:hypothetical protein
MVGIVGAAVAVAAAVVAEGVGFFSSEPPRSARPRKKRAATPTSAIAAFKTNPLGAPVMGSWYSSSFAVSLDADAAVLSVGFGVAAGVAAAGDVAVAGGVAVAEGVAVAVGAAISVGVAVAAGAAISAGAVTASGVGTSTFSAGGGGGGSGSFSIASRRASRAARSSFSPEVPSPRIVPPVLVGSGAASSFASACSAAFSPPSVEGRASAAGALALSGEVSAAFSAVSASGGSPTARMGTT